MADQNSKPETEADLRGLLTEMREKRLKQYDDLKIAPASESRDKDMADVVMRGKRIRSALDFLDGKWTIGDMDQVTAARVATAIFNS